MVAGRADEPVLDTVVARVRDPETFIARINYLYQHRSEDSHEEIDLRDGRVIDRYSAPTIGEDGKYYGRIWFFRDITARKQAEQLLSDSENRYRNLVETTNDWVWEVDENAVYTYASPRAFDIIGYRPAELIGKTPFDLMAPEEAKRVGGLFAPLVASQQPIINLENTCIHKDGHPVVLETSGTPVTGIDGKFCGYRGIDRDITERKQVEQTAMDERNFSNTLIASQPDVFYVLDPIGRFVRWNRKMKEVLGLSDTQLAVTNALAVIQEADRPAVAQKIQEAFAEGAATIDARLITKMGVRDYVFNATSADTEKGRYLVGVGTDITERNLAETMLHESEERLRVIFEGALDGIALMDLETRQITAGNSAVCQMLGYSAEEFVRLSVPDIHPQQDWPYVFEQFDKQMRGEIQLAVDMPVKRKDGSVFYADINTSTVYIGGKHYIVGVFRDITERKQMEIELRKSELAYRTLSQNLPGMVYRVHLRESGRMQFYNDMPVQITGYAVDELITGALCSIEPLIVDEDRRGVEAKVMRSMEQKHAFVVEYRLKHKDGGIRWMEEHGMPVYGTDGAPLYIDGVIFDITEHKQDEIALQLFRTLLDNSSDAIEVLDPSTMCLLDVNETQCRKLGYSREELLSMSIKDIDTDFSANQIKEIKAQIVQTREARFESMYRRKDYTTFPVEVSAKLVEARQTLLDEHCARHHRAQARRGGSTTIAGTTARTSPARSVDRALQSPLPRRIDGTRNHPR